MHSPSSFTPSDAQAFARGYIAWCMDTGKKYRDKTNIGTYMGVVAKEGIARKSIPSNRQIGEAVDYILSKPDWQATVQEIAEESLPCWRDKNPHQYEVLVTLHCPRPAGEILFKRDKAICAALALRELKFPDIYEGAVVLLSHWGVVMPEMDVRYALKESANHAQDRLYRMMVEANPGHNWPANIRRPLKVKVFGWSDKRTMEKNR